MKRLLTILSFALFFTSIQLYGQTVLPVCESTAMPARGETYFGVKGGLNMSKLGKTSGVTSSSLRSGMHAGVYFGYMLADGFSIQPELLYSRQGGKVQGPITRRLDYINLPVMLHYMLPIVFPKLNETPHS